MLLQYLHNITYYVGYYLKAILILLQILIGYEEISFCIIFEKENSHRISDI